MSSWTISLEGFSLDIISPLQEALCCLICSNVLQNPHQAPCGCRFCYNCILGYLKNNERFCPGESELCTEEKLILERDLQKDFFAKREINKLIVKCPLYLCNEELQFRKMKDHLELCASLTVLCSKCNENMRRGDYENHEINNCIEGITCCESCRKMMKRKELQEEHLNFEHDLLCTDYTDYCPNECGENNKVVWVKHRRSCKVKYVECPYKAIGCNSNTLVLKEMSLHITSNGFDHAEELLKHIENLNNEISCIKKTVSDAVDTIGSLEDKYKKQEEEIKQQKDDISNLKNIIVIMKKESLDQQSRFGENMKNKILNSNKDTLISIERVNSEVVKIKKDIELMVNKYDTILTEKFQNFVLKESSAEYKKDDVTLKKDEENSIAIDSFSSEVSNIKEDIEIIKKKFETTLTEKVQESVLQESLEKRKKDDVIVEKKTEPVLVWKIESFLHIVKESSKFFYTHHRGYKMNLSLVNKVKGYLSIYVTVHCGEYDDELSWPIRKSVLVRLLDQNGFGRDYERITSFSDLQGYICQRQYFKTTVYTGIPKFISYEELYSKPFLLKNNCLIIQCFVSEFDS